MVLLEWLFRLTTEGDLVVVLVRKMEATQRIRSANSRPVTRLEFLSTEGIQHLMMYDTSMYVVYSVIHNIYITNTYDVRYKLNLKLSVKVRSDDQFAAIIVQKHCMGIPICYRTETKVVAY